MRDSLELCPSPLKEHGEGKDEEGWAGKKSYTGRNEKFPILFSPLVA